MCVVLQITVMLCVCVCRGEGVGKVVMGTFPLHRAAEYGIYTLLDMHQDVLSEKFCGEGIPDWAVDVGCKSCTIIRL